MSSALVVANRNDQMVTIRSSDEKSLVVEYSVAVRCGSIRKRLSDKIRDVNPDGSLTLTNVSLQALEHVVDFCRVEWPGDFHSPPVRHPQRTEEQYQALLRQHREKRYPRSIGYGSSNVSGTGAHETYADGTLVRPKGTPRFEAFLKSLGPSDLCELASAAYYLEVKPLVDLTCRSIADLIKGRTPEEIRSTFKIKNDFAPAEEEQVRKSILKQTLLMPPDPGEKLLESAQSIMETQHQSHMNQNDMKNFRTGNPTRDKLRSKLLMRRQLSSGTFSQLSHELNERKDADGLLRSRPLLTNGVGAPPSIRANGMNSSSSSSKAPSPTSNASASTIKNRKKRARRKKKQQAALATAASASAAPATSSSAGESASTSSSHAAADRSSLSSASSTGDTSSARTSSSASSSSSVSSSSSSSHLRSSSSVGIAPESIENSFMLNNYSAPSTPVNGVAQASVSSKMLDRVKSRLADRQAKLAAAAAAANSTANSGARSSGAAALPDTSSHASRSSSATVSSASRAGNSNGREAAAGRSASASSPRAASNAEDVAATSNSSSSGGNLSASARRRKKRRKKKATTALELQRQSSTGSTSSVTSQSSVSSSPALSPASTPKSSTKEESSPKPSTNKEPSPNTSTNKESSPKSSKNKEPSPKASTNTESSGKSPKNKESSSKSPKNTGNGSSRRSSGMSNGVSAAKVSKSKGASHSNGLGTQSETKSESVIESSSATSNPEQSAVVEPVTCPVSHASASQDDVKEPCGSCPFRKENPANSSALNAQRKKKAKAPHKNGKIAHISNGPAPRKSTADEKSQGGGGGGVGGKKSQRGGGKSKSKRTSANEDDEGSPKVMPPPSPHKNAFQSPTTPSSVNLPSPDQQQQTVPASLSPLPSLASLSQHHSSNTSSDADTAAAAATENSFDSLAPSLASLSLSLTPDGQLDPASLSLPSDPETVERLASQCPFFAAMSPSGAGGHAGPGGHARAFSGMGMFNFPSPANSKH